MSVEDASHETPNAVGAHGSRQARRPPGSAVAALLSAAVFVGLAGLAIAGLHRIAAADAPRAAPPPLRIETVELRLETGYRRLVTYTGRLEARRQAALAFERGGLVVAVVRDEGDDVRAGEVIARLDATQLLAGRAELVARRRELDAQRHLASLTQGRQARLKSLGWSPEQRLDEAEANVAQLVAAIDRVDAQIAGIDIDLSKSELKAPFDGRVGARLIDEGAVIAAGAPILTLFEAGRRIARIGVPPDVADALDRQAVLRADIQGRESPVRILGRRPDLETGTRTVTLLLEVASDAPEHPLGELVHLRVESVVAQPGSWLPLTALKEGRRGLWTVLVVEGGEAHRTVRAETVEVLHVEASRVFVRGTIRAGDHVVATGTDRVVAGQRVASAGGPTP